MRAAPKTANERVSVNLKMLIDLAKHAKPLKRYRSKIRAARSGGYLSPTKGRGMEFDEARLYQPGDDIRAIDWRVTARRGKTHTKIYREERERPVLISVDCRPSMDFASRGCFKSVQAAKMAALLAWRAEQHGDRIGGQVFSEQGFQELKPQAGKQAVLHFLNALVSPRYAKQEPLTLEQVVSRLAKHAGHGSLIYLISDFRGLSTKAEMQLSKLARHSEVVLIHIYDPLESQLPNRGRYRFTDGLRDITVDTADKRQVNDYQQQFQQRQALLQKLSRKWQFKLIECQTTDNLLEVIR
jgi:uncharacterized protein (DUF58 family)